jgi:O-antigen ligase
MRAKLALHAPASALLLWVCLWANLNTGFWNIQSPSSFDDWQLAIRATLPFVVFPIALLLLLGRRDLELSWRNPSLLLMAYGTLAALASLYSPEPGPSLYWSLAFMATIVAAWTFIDPRNLAGSSRQLLQLTWVATFIVAALIARQASHAIFGHVQTAYGSVTKELEDQSRSSGVARWAAVPGLVCLVRAYHNRRAVMIALYLTLAALAFFIVYRMQSRGAVFGIVAALAFALVIESRMRRYALPFAVMAIVFVLFLDSPATISNRVTTYLERGQSREEFLSMTGRTRAYRKGIAAFEEAPILGRGQWADRLIFQEHIHNSYLQALLNAGILGGLPYFVSWLSGWVLFFHLHKRSRLLNPEDRLSLLEAGTVMMFFTARSIPETTTASFSVDLLVMIAVYVYLESLVLHVRGLESWRYRSTPQAILAHSLTRIHNSRTRHQI